MDRAFENLDRKASEQPIDAVMSHRLTVARDAVEDLVDDLLGLDDEVLWALVVGDQRAPHAVTVAVRRAALSHVTS